MKTAALSARYTPDCISIHRGNLETPLTVQNAAEDSRPYIHPLFAPDLNGILTENAPPHHAWQHGLYVGLNDVNGVGFWTEGLTRNPNDGTFHPRPLKAPVASGNRVTWSVETVWRGPKNDEMLLETQAWQFVDRGADYWLDLTWTLTASIDLAFGKYSYGGLFLRMPYDAKRGGAATNDAGKINGEAEAQRARWVAVAMPIPLEERPAAARDAGIAILDHAKNPEHPVPWRVDGQLGIGPSRCIAGAWKLPAGQSVVYRHRVYVFCGTTDANAINAIWQDFSRDTPST